MVVTPEDHPVKGILPIRFRKGDGDTQSGESRGYASVD